MLRFQSAILLLFFLPRKIFCLFNTCIIWYTLWLMNFYINIYVFISSPVVICFKMVVHIFCDILFGITVKTFLYFMISLCILFFGCWINIYTLLQKISSHIMYWISLTFSELKYCKLISFGLSIYLMACSKNHITLHVGKGKQLLEEAFWPHYIPTLMQVLNAQNIGLLEISVFLL